MSTQIMAACWPLQLPPTSKAVLISLADNANDSAICWPSVSTICYRTCFSERTVQGAIQWLLKNELLAVEIRPGRSTRYRILVEVPSRNPRSASGASQMLPPPAAIAPDPRSSRPQNRKETSGNPKKTAEVVSRSASKGVGVEDLVAEGVDRLHAEDWLEARRAKRAPLTATVWANVKAEAEKGGITVAEAVRIAASFSWQGFKAAWLDKSDRRPAREPKATMHDGFEDRAYGKGGPL